MAFHQGAATVLAALVLATGIGVGGWQISQALGHMAGGRQSITVKGLAEKPVRADQAQWSVGVRVVADDFASALAELRQRRPVLDRFLQQQGFPAAALSAGPEQVEPNVVVEYLDNGQPRETQRGFVASQNLLVSSADLQRVAAASRAVLQLQASGEPVVFSRPQYLVSQLEQIKMSLISDATQNARQRAQEFVKHGDVKVGALRSAAQGAFYILPAGSNSEASDYGGTYDKTTIDKLARVVVTIEYGVMRP